MHKLSFEPCIPTRGTKLPAGPNWLHEVKHDASDRWSYATASALAADPETDRYPLIVEAALCKRSSSFVIDGKAVLLGIEGVSVFHGLMSRQHDDEVQLYALGILALGLRSARVSTERVAASANANLTFRTREQF